MINTQPMAYTLFPLAAVFAVRMDAAGVLPSVGFALGQPFLTIVLEQ